MNKLNRIANFVAGIAIIICCILVAIYPDDGYKVAMLFIFIALFISGIREIVYYVKMARYMNGGRIVLYKGMIFAELGMVTLFMANIPEEYVFLYLLGCIIFSGLVDILRAREMKAYEAPSWKVKMAIGVISVVLALVCLFFLRSSEAFVYAFALCFVPSGLARISSAFKKSEIIYIQ